MHCGFQHRLWPLAAGWDSLPYLAAKYAPRFIGDLNVLGRTRRLETSRPTAAADLRAVLHAKMEAGRLMPWTSEDA
jgi:hypothetical protein